MASTVNRSYTHSSPSRANFMMLALTTMLGVVGLTYLGAVIAYLIPRKGEGARPQNIGRLSANSVGSFAFKSSVAGPIVYDATGHGDVQGVFVVQTGSTGSAAAKDYLVIEQTCTHLGCPVAWTPGGGGNGSFNCPCHGSQFNKRGDHIAGPAPTGLYRHNFSIKNGEFIVKERIT